MPYKGGLSGLEAAGYLHAAGFSGADLQTAIAIAKAESGMNPKAKGGPNTNGTYDWGLMQINDVHKPSDAVKTEPYANAQAAFRIYKAAGSKFTPWSTFANGAYKANMEFARQSVVALQSAGPKYERDLIAGKNPGSNGNPITLDPPGSDGGLSSIPGVSALSDGVSKAIGSGINAVNDQIGKVAGNALTITVAIVFLVLGVVILLRSAVTGGVIGIAKKAL